MIKMFIGLHVKYRLFLSDLKEAFVFSTDFRKKYSNKIFMKICPVGVEWFPADGPQDEANSRFSQFCYRT